MSSSVSRVQVGSIVRARIGGKIIRCKIVDSFHDAEGSFYRVRLFSPGDYARFCDVHGECYVQEHEILPLGMIRGHNGDLAHTDAGCPLVGFFSKAGSLFEKRESYYGGETSALDLFKKAWKRDRSIALKLLFWVRDCRGGAGNRSGFRSILHWLAGEGKDWLIANLPLIPQYGRWDDLLVLQGTDCESVAFAFWARAILAGDHLAAKWAPRADKCKTAFNLLRRAAGMGPGDFRRLLASHTRVVETLMCEQRFSDIDYSHVPSIAMARYNNAFGRNDSARFSSWKEEVLAGTSSVNASVLFPHDVLRTMYADPESPSRLAELQFAALPDYMAGNDLRIMTVCDFSGSMCVPVSGSIRAIDISLGLGLYCSDRLGKANPFYRKVIPFSRDSRLVSWRDMSFCEAARALNDGYVGSTNLTGALRKILEAGVMFGASNEQMPNCLLIISDMQFDGGVDRSGDTAVESVMREWLRAGYDMPRIVYWNTAGYAGWLSLADAEYVALVSGFSPSILSSVLSGELEKPTPGACMLKAIEKYQLICP